MLALMPAAARVRGSAGLDIIFWPGGHSRSGIRIVNSRRSSSEIAYLGFTAGVEVTVSLVLAWNSVQSLILFCVHAGWP